MNFSIGLRAAWAAALPLALLLPRVAAACACGCGIFDVGTGSNFPDGSGGLLYVESNYLDQDSNYSGSARSPAAANPGQRIRSRFLTFGTQYMFNRAWGVVVELPYWRRDFVTTEGLSTASYSHGALGDVRIKGVYSGFSDDMSTGITAGLKLATGDSSYPNFDADTEIGSGSTDLLLGAYHLGALSDDGRYSYFVRTQWQQPLASKAGYRPGSELVGVAGGYYAGWNFGRLRLAPIAQLTAVWRGHDAGPLARPTDSGYTRLLFAPGLEADVGRTRVFLDAAFALSDNVSGQQLIARRLYTLHLSYRF